MRMLYIMNKTDLAFQLFTDEVILHSCSLYSIEYQQFNSHTFWWILHMDKIANNDNNNTKFI